MQLDLFIESILKVAAPFIIPTAITINNIDAFKKNKYRLQKLSKYDGYIIADNNFIHSKINNISKSKIGTKKQEILIPYIEKLKNYIKEGDLKIVYNNLYNLNIKYDPKLVASGCAGKYIIEENKLLYTNKSSVGHEFLHMASAMYDADNNIKLCGFYQEKDGAAIAEGITEGYTELLASRLYNKNGKVDVYKQASKICEILEFFFDDPKDMAHLYFNCNLPGLIKHLEEYSTRKEVIKLIMDIDSIVNYETAFANPYSLAKSIEVQLKLYNWFSSKSNNSIKIKQLENMLRKNKVMSILLNKNMSLCKNNIYTNNDNKNKRL